MHKHILVWLCFISLEFILTSGVPLGDENDFESDTRVSRSDFDLDELFETVDVAREDDDDFLAQLNKRASFTSAQRLFQNQVLQAHNLYRARHCAPALKLDDGLSISAQNYAQRLASTNTFAHSGTAGVGENLYMANGIKINGNTPVNYWYNEIKYYNFNKGGFSMATGHFTQIVWRNSKKLGVGIAYGNGGRSVFVVTQYSPPGNVMGQFQANVIAKSRC